jgi:hypothetical protein
MRVHEMIKRSGEEKKIVILTQVTTMAAKKRKENFAYVDSAALWLYSVGAEGCSGNGSSQFVDRVADNLNE